MYKIIVDGFCVGVMELTREDVIAMSCDPDIRIIKVNKEG